MILEYKDFRKYSKVNKIKKYFIFINRSNTVVLSMVYKNDYDKKYFYIKHLKAIKDNQESKLLPNALSQPIIINKDEFFEKFNIYYQTDDLQDAERNFETIVNANKYNL